MSNFLLAISIGPVQDFIASARRMGDLYSGSKILSDISLDVARVVADATGRENLIFPYPDALENKDASVANVILAEVKSSDAQTLRKIAANAKNAAVESFKSKAMAAYGKLQDSINADVWASQLEDVVEFFAAWVKESGIYSDDREKVMQFLAARKATREFVPAHGFQGIFKSSLDGLRESVLVKKANHPMLALNSNECLDCIGVTKRFHSNKVARYPSITTIAASSWLRQLKQSDIGSWNGLADIHRHLQSLGVIPQVPAGMQDVLSGWAYDASPLYEHRHEAILSDVDAEKKDKVKASLKEIKKILSKAKKSVGGSPSSYYAFILADGDRMGETLGILRTPEEHREFSKKLEQFATSVPKICSQNGAHCIYSGGDDVMAFAPLDVVLKTVRALHDAFGESMQNEDLAVQPTLSVGVVIAHVLEPLDLVREFAKMAEKLAKGTDRNGLGISLHTRGIETADVRGRWSNAFDSRLQEWIVRFQNQRLPSNLPYATRRDLENMEHWESADAIAAALPARLAATWKHKLIKVDDDSFIKSRISAVTSWKDFEQLLCELRVARFMAMGDDV